MILSFFKKLFSRKKETMSDITSNKQTRKHKLEIQIFEADYTEVPDGQPPKWRSVRMEKPVIVEVADEQEFAEIRKQYAMCDQKIQVIREIDPFDDAPKAVTNNTQQSTSNKVDPTINNNAQSAQVIQQTPAIQTTQIQNVQQPTVIIKPKIITVGDTQIKYDGEKVYSRQWVKLTSKESSYIRLVNDSNNKLVNLNGKHFEALRWVLVENDSQNDDIDASIESILND